MSYNYDYWDVNSYGKTFKYHLEIILNCIYKLILELYGQKYYMVEEA